MAKRLFTSESVTEGHPDKVCDQISDAVLDDILAHDPNAHVACETFTTTGIVTVMGEITTKHYTDIPSIVRRTVERIGVETPFDGNMSDGEYLQKRIQMTGGGLATSGNYRRFYLDGEGNKVAHTIDPRTGRSALSRLLSVTVAAPTCAEADALGTMFLAMGADDALAAVERMPGVKAYFILAGDGGEYEEYVSPAMEALILK